MAAEADCPACWKRVGRGRKMRRATRAPQPVTMPTRPERCDVAAFVDLGSARRGFGTASCDWKRAGVIVSSEEMEGVIVWREGESARRAGDRGSVGDDLIKVMVGRMAVTIVALEMLISTVHSLRIDVSWSSIRVSRERGIHTSQSPPD